MGRAHEVRAASMAKTNLMKSKLYSKYGKLIYMEAKNGGADPNSNLKLRSLIEKAKKDQVPADVIKRNVDKAAKGGAGENFSSAKYDAFGPAGSTFIIEALTDNGNRTFSALKGYCSKCGAHLGAAGSVSYTYNYENILVFKEMGEEEVLDTLMMAEVEPQDISSEDGVTTVVLDPKDSTSAKEALKAACPTIDFTTDEVVWTAKDTVELAQEDLDKVQRFMGLLDQDDDVTNVYHNIANMPEEE